MSKTVEKIFSLFSKGLLEAQKVQIGSGRDKFQKLGCETSSIIFLKVVNVSTWKEVKGKYPEYR